jgi:hemerythrin-like domain-containing protein
MARRRLRQTRITLTDPIDVLLNEHALHRRMLSVLERIASFVGSGGRFPSDDVAKVLDYLRDFVESVHHGKEDTAVYPLVLEVSEESVAETVGRLVSDHVATKELLHSLTMFWEPGDLLEPEREGFAQMVRAYTTRMRRHMALEELHLFPNVRRLGERELAAMERRCAEISAGHRDALSWSRVIAALEERWT